MKGTLGNITDKILIAAVVVAVFASGYQFGEKQALRQPRATANYSVSGLEEGNTENIDFSLFWEAWNKLENKYVDAEELDPQQMYYGAIRGMVASVDDSYTFFLTPEENAESKRDLEGKFFGIGAELGLRNRNIVIVSPLENSPAEAAGVRPGDIIVEVDGESTEGWTLFEAVNNIRGEKGSEVVLTMVREGVEDTVDIPIVRDEINIPFVELSYEQNNAIIELSRFGNPTNDLWDDAVDDIIARQRQGQLNGIVLDMRGNPGGFLQSAVHVASEFVDKDTLLVKQEYADQEPEIYVATRNGRLTDVPIVILQNEGSASASEIVAGALRDTVDAQIVGTNSFGKGTVQVAEDLQDGAGIHITISKWILPDGGWIQDSGLEPDIRVENDIADGNTITRETDNQLDTALQVLNGNSVVQQ